MKWKPYPKNKESGVEWLGAVPEEWDVTPLKHVASLKGRLGWQGLRADEYTEEGPHLVTSEHFSNEKVDWKRCYHVSPARYAQAPQIQLRPDDLLIMKDGAAMGKLAYVDSIPGPACLNSHLLLLRPLNGRFANRFLFYVLGGPSFKSYMTQERTGTTFFGISQESIGSFRLALPPLAEQHRILEPLKREVTRIDTLIAKQERLIELLQEKRHALISHAVTKGLNPNAPMKPSGVEWLGDVPAHWTIAALAYRYEVALGKMLDGKQIVGDQLAAYLRNVDVQWDRINVAELPEMDFALSDRARFSLRSGDLMVCEGGDVGRAAIWEGQLSECYYQKALHRLRAHQKGRDNGRFMLYVLWDSASKGRFTASEGRSTIAHLTAEALQRYLFAFPPKDEQTQIALHLDRECAKVDALLSKVRDAIALMREHRTALISAAVTGKIDVREPKHA